jgi:large subunit ribosomal protein L9
MSRRSTNLLLLEDVLALGRSGDIVSVKPGYARNFLVPNGKALRADKRTMRLQEELKKKRAAQAIKDKADAEALAKRLDGQTFATERKVDDEGHMYGSVSVNDLIELLEKTGFNLEKKSLDLPHAIKTTGVHNIVVKLKEEVTCSFILKVIPEGGEDIIDTTVKKNNEKKEKEAAEMVSQEESTEA